MANMDERELLALVNAAERDAVAYNGEFMRENERMLSQYLGDPYGDEVEGMSQVVSTDIADVIESDMPSLVRIFLGAHDLLEFEPTSSNPRDVDEAEKKTKYINYIVRSQEDSFKIIHDWLKDSLIQKLGVVKFFYDEKEESDEVKYDGLSQDELVALLADLEQHHDKVEILEQNTDDPQDCYIKFKVTNKKKKYVIANVPTEEFLISKNARNKNTAELVGDKTFKTKGELIADGFDKNLVKSLPSPDEEENSNLKTIRNEDTGGQYIAESISHWASHRVKISDLYVLVDYDDDGIPERRHIMKCGNEILVNEPFPLVPYAINSSILMPHKAIGRSRAEVVKQTQRIKTVLYRQMLDNIYRVNAGRVVTNDQETNIDDLLTVRYGGVVRTKGDPMASVAQLQTPYIGDQALQIVQYVDTVRAQSTGMTLSNQGIDADRLYKETATRFEGVKDAGAAKVELIARVFAETGFRDLYMGLAWMAAHYQNEQVEIMVLGEPLAIDPRLWRYEHNCRSTVGLAAGDEEQQLANMGSLLTIHQQLAANGSVLTDEKKIYNTLKKVVKAMGIERVNDYFNDPEVPQETLMAQLQNAQKKLAQMQDPLVAIEAARSQGRVQVEQVKQDAETHRFIVEMEAQQNQMKNQMDEFNRTLMAKLTELELKYNQNVPGSSV